MRRLILNIHLVIGLVAGVFVILLGTTGSILAFETELDRFLYRDTSYVKPGGKVLSLTEIGDAVSRKYPGEPVVAYLTPPAPDFPAGVILSRGIVLVDPYTGEVLGVRKGLISQALVPDFERFLKVALTDRRQAANTLPPLARGPDGR